MPKIFLIVGAPAVGKKTLIRKVAQSLPNVAEVLSYTDRPALPEEVAGRDYIFCSKEEFSDLISRGEFLEWDELPEGRYGTVKSLYYEHLECGNIPVKTITPTQYERVMDDLTDEFVTIYITPPSTSALAERRYMAGYKSDILAFADYGWESRNVGRYNHLIVNNDVSLAAERLYCILERYIIEEEQHQDILARNHLEGVGIHATKFRFA